MKPRNIAAHVMEPTAKPFLKWAGAKRKLVGRLLDLLPVTGRRFFEPFVGSGVVFMNTRYPASLLSDSNQDIISLYSVLKVKHEEFIADCKRLFTTRNNAAERFYELREEFNTSRDPARRAAIFVYLNRHCFNGLCRYNNKGEFNTPFGRYDRVPYFPADEMLAFARKLRTAKLQTMDFRKALPQAGQDDVVYCDPPYEPLTATANFTSYAAGGFGQQDQRDLHALALEASERGAVVVISNHDTLFTQKLYSGASRLEEVLVSRTISCNGQNRKKARELIAVFGEVVRSESLL
jgi:DNA adenine methylase